MNLIGDGDALHYSSMRAGAEFLASHGPTSDVYHAKPGSLEHWLTERYCLYAMAPDGSIWRNEVQHLPWPLQAAKAQFDRNTMFSVHGIATPEVPPLLHFAERLDAVIWDADRVA